MTEYTENGLPIVTRTTIDRVLEAHCGDRTVQEINYWQMMENDNQRLYDFLQRKKNQYIKTVNAATAEQVFRPCAYAYAFLTVENKGPLVPVDPNTIREITVVELRPENRGKLDEYFRKMEDENGDLYQAIRDLIPPEADEDDSMGLCVAMYFMLDKESEIATKRPN